MATEPSRNGGGRVDLRDLDRAGLEAFAAGLPGGSAARGRAVFQAIWQAGAKSLDEMTGVAGRFRKTLAASATLGALEVASSEHSTDGTVKLLWRLADGNVIESVIIPETNRLTLCISSQVGCAMGCTFCVTGDLGLIRNLTPGEIAAQVLQAQRDHTGGRRITNVVLMGMGEPLHNLERVSTALRILLDDFGLCLSHRKITVSTSGLVPKLEKLAADLPVNLAISLHATHEDQRREIMPISKKWSIVQLIEACKTLPLPSGKRIAFEYLLIADFNDTEEDADRLVVLLEGVAAKVNLIPYNENPDRNFRRPDDAAVKRFQDRLVRQGLATSIRATRGRDISAACGQLGVSQRESTCASA